MDKLLNISIDSKRLKELKTDVLMILTAPVIYSLFVPALIMDLFVQLYQDICFPVYGIPKVKRSDYIKNDRHRLQYLTSVKKVNCAYCAYFNGVIAFVREVAGRTEQYWCPIKHATRPKDRHEKYENFIPYGDDINLERRWEEKRREILIAKYLSLLKNWFSRSTRPSSSSKELLFIFERKTIIVNFYKFNKWFNSGRLFVE